MNHHVPLPEPRRIANAMIELRQMLSAGMMLMPLAPTSKKPRDSGWRELDYSNFDAEGWLNQGGNVGVRLDANTVVLDIDPRNGGDESWKRLVWELNDDDVVVRTGGGGRHVYLRKPADVAIRGRLANYPGVDVKHIGGFVVAPGSLHPETGRAYALESGSFEVVRNVPSRLLENLRRSEPTDRGGDSGSISASQLELLLSTLDPTDFPKYDDWLRISAACHDAVGGDADGMAVWLDWCARDPAYGAEAAPVNEAKWNTFTAGRADGVTARTLFRAVVDAGHHELVAGMWTSDAEFDDDVGPDEQLVGDEWSLWFSEHFSHAGRMDPKDIPHTQWLIEGLLLQRDVTLVGGRGGVGKSLHAWQIGLSVATGVPFARWNPPGRPRRVLIISGEDDPIEIERRVSAACQAMGVSRADIGENLMVWQDRAIHLAEKEGRSGAVKRTKLWHGIRWAVENRDVGLIIIDPLVKASAGFDESSNGDMDTLFQHIRALTDGFDCSVLIDDHFAKGGVAGDQASIRGASAKVDAARVALTLSQMTDEDFRRLKPPKPASTYVHVFDPKQNYAKKRGGQWLELVEYQVGNGEVRPAMKMRDLESTKDFEDTATWVHRDTFLTLVKHGRTNGAHTGWPWCTAAKGPRDSRLEVAMAEAFDLTRDEALGWIQSFADKGQIVQEMWESPTRNRTSVWRLAQDEPAAGGA